MVLAVYALTLCKVTCAELGNAVELAIDTDDEVIVLVIVGFEQCHDQFILAPIFLKIAEQFVSLPKTCWVHARGSRQIALFQHNDVDFPSALQLHDNSDIFLFKWGRGVLQLGCWFLITPVPVAHRSRPRRGEAGRSQIDTHMLLGLFRADRA